MTFSAVLVTRGNVDLAPVIAEINGAGIENVIVWDNSKRRNFGVAGRYEAIEEAIHGAIYAQDDDCIIDVSRVLAAYEPGRLVANMPVGRWPDYPDSALVGWGSVFDRNLPRKAFRRYFERAAEIDPARWRKRNASQAWSEFTRTCDVVFSSLTPRTIIDIGFRHREFAEGPDRMFKQPGHKQERDRVLDRCREIRGEDDDVRVSA